MSSIPAKQTLDSPLPHKALRYDSLDLARGFGCLMVLVAHCVAYSSENRQYWAEGDVVANGIMKVISYFFVAVPMFFVISGYGLAAATLAMHGKKTPFKSFFVRRLRRVYPPAWAIIVITTILTGVAAWAGYQHLFLDETLPIPSAGHALTWWEWVGNLSMTEMWLHHFTDPIDGSKVFGPNLMVSPLWSICYEEQFYVLVGLSLLLARKWFFKFVMALTVLTLVMIPLQYAYPHLPIRGFFFDGQWLLFAVGVLVYYRAVFCGARGKRICDVVMVGLVVGCFGLRLSMELPAMEAWMMSWVGDEASFQHVQIRLAHYLAGFISALGMCWLQKYDQWFMSRPWLQWLKALGTFSYSIYLVHWPVTKLTSHLLYDAGVRGHWMTILISIPVGVALSLPLAWVFYQLVEKKCMNRPHAATAAGARTPVGGASDTRPALMDKEKDR